VKREKFPIISVLLLFVTLSSRSTQYVIIEDWFFGFLLGVSTVNLFTYGHMVVSQMFEGGRSD